MIDQKLAPEDVIALALRLSTLDKLRLIERLASVVEYDLKMEQPSQPTPERSLQGLWADLGPAPSAEEIDETRREAWANFPREDIA